MPSVNTMDFMQASSLLNALRKQATGQTALAPTSEAEFVSVATTLLQMGVDPIMNAISQMVGCTIFSFRPYSAKFKGIEVDAQTWGYITRKLSIADKDFVNDAGFTITDGQSVDQYVVSAPSVLQVNFYGQNIFQKYYTIFRDQLNSAFTSSAQFGEFVTLVTQNALDLVEQTREVVRRMTIANFIGGKLAMESAAASEYENGVIHALTDYNADTGSSLTAVTVYAKENFDDFCKWLRAKIATVSKMMSERTILFQGNISGKAITRHTPVRDQKMYLYSPFVDQMNARVLADTFNEQRAEYADFESVNFWQSAKTPDTINIKPAYLKVSDGTIIEASDAVSKAGIIGVIFDRDALGVTIMNEETSTTPYNSRGRYWNTWLSFIQRYWNDFTEKGAVILLD